MNELLWDRDRLAEILGELGFVPLSDPGVTTIFDEMVVHEERLPGRNIDFRGQAVADAMVFNDPGDRDEYRILGSPPRRSVRERLRPVIDPDQSSVWVRYRVRGELALRAKARFLEELRSRTDASRELTLLDYRRHDPSERVVEAVVADASRPRSLLRPDDLLEIREGEALALVADQAIDLSFSVSFAEVQTELLGRLGRALGHAPVTIRTDARAKLTVPVSIEGSLMTIVTSRPKGLLFAIRTVSENQRSARLTVSISSGLGSSKTISAAVSSFLLQWFEAPLKKLHAILRKATLEDLSRSERDLVERILKRLGLGDELATLEEIRDYVARLEAEAAGAIHEVLSKKVRASLRYETERSAEATDLLAFLVDRQSRGRSEWRRRIRAIHRRLLDGDVSALSKLVSRDDSDIELLQYLNRRITRRESDTSFTLSVDDWRYGARESSAEVVTLENEIDGGLVVSVDNRRRFEEKRGVFAASEWLAELEAEMKGAVSDPVAADFDFGFELILRDRYDRFSSSDSLRLQTLGTAWGVDRGAIASELPDLVGRRRVTARLGFRMDENELRQALRVLDSSDDMGVSLALARALPIGRRGGLRDPEEAWRWSMLIERVLAGERISRSEVHRISAAIADDAGSRALAGREREASSGRTMSEWLPGSVISNHPNLESDWRRFLEGARLLSEALDTGATHYRHLPKIIRLLSSFWSRAWYVRALPILFAELATAARIDPDVTLRVDVEEEAGILVRSGRSIR